MPTPIKLILSVLVTAVAVGYFWLQDHMGVSFDRLLPLGLGGLMVLALWLFPETKGKKQKGER